MAADFSRIHGTCLALNREVLAVTPRESGGPAPRPAAATRGRRTRAAGPATTANKSSPSAYPTKT